MKKVKPEVFILSLDIYKRYPIIVIDGEISDAIDHVRKVGNTRIGKNIVKHYEDNIKDYPDNFMEDVGAHGRLYTGIPHTNVLIVKRSDSYIDTTDTVVHEATHLTHYVLREAGVELTKESEEAYTYLVAHIVTEIIKKLWPPKKDKKTKAKSKK